jgi:hypothetical protein
MSGFCAGEMDDEERERLRKVKMDSRFRGDDGFAYAFTLMTVLGSNSSQFESQARADFPIGNRVWRVA